jgi:hypothetical protein
VSPLELLSFLDEAGRMLPEARELDPGTWFEHFAFGILNRDKAVRFIGVHNRHHLRIISDIARKGVTSTAPGGEPHKGLRK